MNDYQITCINVSSSDPTPGGITHVAGPLFQKITRRRAVELIDARRASFYTLVNGRRANVRAIHRWNSEPYITTDPDDSTTNNLLSLPICR